MAIAVTNSFTSDGKGISAEVNKNFAEIAAELNALPTVGAWKGSNVIATANIQDHSLGGSLFSSGFIFQQIPKGPSGVDPSHSDHFVPERYIDNLAMSLLLPYRTAIATGVDRLIVSGGVIVSGSPLTAVSDYSEVFTFGNKMMFEVGLKLCPSEEATSQVITVDLLAGFNKILFAWGTLMKKDPVSSSFYGQASVYIGARSQLTFSTSNKPQSEFYGITYFVVGC